MSALVPIRVLRSACKPQPAGRAPFAAYCQRASACSMVQTHRSPTSGARRRSAGSPGRDSAEGIQLCPWRIDARDERWARSCRGRHTKAEERFSVTPVSVVLRRASIPTMPVSVIARPASLPIKPVSVVPCRRPIPRLRPLVTRGLENVCEVAKSEGAGCHGSPQLEITPNR